MIIRQSLESIGKKVRHKQGDLTTTLNELDANNIIAIKDRLSIVQSNAIDKNDIAKNTTTEDSILNIDTGSILRCNSCKTFLSS